MDVHPPLAKMLITLAAWLAGFKGDFDFKEIAREYDHVPYVAMRLLPATLGLLLVPIGYLTLRALQTRPTTAVLGALFLTFENGLITQSRFILLDSPLVFFTALSVFFWVGFSNEDQVPRDRAGKVGPFSRRWWVWLTLTGLSLGAVVSCKWVGLFTIATIGILTVVQLWNLLGDLRVPIPLLLRHFIARAICLIAVPSLFYMAMFAIHFRLLQSSGEGDGFMSSEFQHTLNGHGMDDTFQDVMIGSHITLRHVHTQGGYLHSHPHVYPTGSKQQQITLYPHRDDNNIWQVLEVDDIIEDEPAEGEEKPPKETIDPETLPLQALKDGAIITLNHDSTNKKLHSHDVRAPVTDVDYQNEVTAYGFEGFEGDANDHFQVEIDQVETDTSGAKDAKTRVQALRTRFRLRHTLSGCYLFSHKVKLPDWGFEQQEVTCNKNPPRENALWYIETNTHRQLGEFSAKVNYRVPGFLAKFVELQAVMWRTNAGLTDRHAYDSRPSAWPGLRRGINFWVKDHRQVYLIGNPFVWWLSTVSVLLYVGVRGLIVLRAQRGYKDLLNTTVSFYDQLCGFLVLGWFMHYFPFFLMSRQLFLHHYFPALYFAVLLLACTFDLATRPFQPKIRLQVAGVMLLLTLWAFWHWSALTYAGEWTQELCEKAKWGKHWDFSCADFHHSLTDYHPAAALRVDHDATAEPATTFKDQVEPGPHAFADEKQKPQTSAVEGDADVEQAEPTEPPYVFDDEELAAYEAEHGPIEPERDDDDDEVEYIDVPYFEPKEMVITADGAAIPAAAAGTDDADVLRGGLQAQAQAAGRGDQAARADITAKPPNHPAARNAEAAVLEELASVEARMRELEAQEAAAEAESAYLQEEEVAPVEEDEGEDELAQEEGGEEEDGEEAEIDFGQA